MENLRIPQVAEELGVSKSLAYRLLKTDGLPYVRVSDRRLVVRRQDLEAWLESRVTRQGDRRGG